MLKSKSGMAAHVYNPSSLEMEIGGLWSEASLGKKHETLSEK
jgi:hypothetical protein